MAGLSNNYPQYAPAADLNAYLGVTVPDADALLQRASGSIRDLTKTAIYGTPFGSYIPTDTLIANAFHDATVLQAAALVGAGVKPGDQVASQDGTIQSKTLGSRSVTYGIGAGTAEAKNELLNGKVCPEAVSVLSAAGLLSSVIRVGGERSWDILAREWVVDGGAP